MSTRRLALDVDVRPPFDGAALLRWLGARAVPGVEEVTGIRYRRVLPLPSGPVVLEVDLGADRAAAALIVPADTASDGRGSGVGESEARALVPAAVRALVDGDVDPSAVLAALGGDPHLGPLVRARPGLRCPGTVDPAELAVRAVLGQQVSVAAARTVAGRLAADLGLPLAAPSGTLRWAFPTPQALATLAPDSLPMPRSRTRALLGLAAALADDTLELSPATDPGAAREALLSIPGIGPWTADYVAMRALADRDAFPAGDLVLRRAARDLGLPHDEPGLRRHARAWRPWRAYAAHHLWAGRG
ncbi:AlkA N-terminal domain-containing protein [Paraconexibacter sp.]|uniref:AlkA N-terminal domain-containing protein n=1 Tax=Paraconexibacter sp. TaxID=2949640 RepID=UPI003564E68C